MGRRWFDFEGDYWLVCVNLCPSRFTVLSVSSHLCTLCFCQCLVINFIATLTKYMRPRGGWAWDEYNKFSQILRKIQGFSCVRIIFAHKIPTIDNIPENRTTLSQSLQPLKIRRVFQKRGKKCAIMKFCWDVRLIGRFKPFGTKK